LSKWERTAETMRAALNALTSVDPQWLTEHADPEWFERYGRRIEDQRVPKGKEARTGYLQTVGADGMQLLRQLDAPYTPQGLKELSEVEILRQIWQQYYEQIDGGERYGSSTQKRCLKVLGASNLLTRWRHATLPSAR
jgi:transposase